MKTLENTYCRPTKEAEWDLVCPTRQYIEGRVVFTVAGEPMPHIEPYYLTEIPVQQFIDLLEDRIVPWRLKEIGFEYNEYRGKVLSELSKYITTENENHCIDFDPNDGIVKVNLNGFEGVETFTDLLTLIRFLK